MSLPGILPNAKSTNAIFIVNGIQFASPVLVRCGQWVIAGNEDCTVAADFPARFAARNPLSNTATLPVTRAS